MKKVFTMMLAMVLPIAAWCADFDTFQAKTEEGVLMTFRVISEAKKTCQVGQDNVFYSSVNINTSGTVTIPSSVNGYTVTTIGGNSFPKCNKITSIIIPNTVERISGYAFTGENFNDENLTSLNSINIPSSVKYIGPYAFANTCITSITIPSSVTYIDNSAFDSCNKLTSISVDANNTKYDSRNSCNAIIETATNKLIAGISTTTVPTDVESIDDRAFFGITGLTEVSLSASVKSIGEYAFYKCTNLKNVTIAGNITTIGENAFSYCNKLEKFSINRFVPLNISYTIFPSIQNTTLYVPSGSKVAYEEAYIWKDFKEIVEMEAPAVPGAIVFADAKVKYICVNNWDTNDDHELTKAEIEAITELGSTFTSTNITSFDELQYFTGLTSIGSQAFSNCPNLTRVTIPSSVTSIGNQAFRGCTNLTHVTIPSSVISIDNNAFYSCSGLENITIPGAVTTIGNYAFYKCTGLASVTIPNSVTSIGQNCFQSCSGLATLTIENAATSIGASAFNGCSNLASVSLGNSVTSIGQSAFALCTTLSSIVIPNSISTIEGYTFYQCTSLTNVTISNNVTSIGSYAFLGCTSLENIVIPNTVTSIGQSAFEDCSSLKNITIPKSVTSIGNKAFFNTGIFTNASDGVFYVDKWACGYKGTMPSNTTIAFDEGTYAVSAGAFYSCNEIMEITIPNSVVIIDVMAFAYCSNLTTVTIGNSVTSIGYMAFYNCSNLATVTVGATTPPTLGSDGLSSYFVNYGSLYVPVGSKAAYKAADNWKNVLRIYENSPKIVFADATVKATCIEKWDTDGDREISEYEAGLVTSLGNAFSGKQITSFDELRYFTGLTTIGGDDFNGCNALKSIIIPSGVTIIHPFAFCQSGLETLSIDANNATFYSPAGSNAIINRATKELVKGCKTTIIPDDVTSIGEGAFYYCTGLTSVDIPSGVNSIADYAFSECSSLVSITIPNTVKSIGEMAFSYCPMTSITIPEGVETIGNNAFWNCTGLTSIVLPGSISSFGKEVFRGCTNLATVTITDGIEAIGEGMFFSCRNLTFITIPSSVTSIGSSAFSSCSNLENITIPSSVTSIGNYAFNYCSALSSLTVEWQKPIYISSSVFSNLNQGNATLYVPAGRETAYKTASYWKNFNIVEMSVHSSAIPESTIIPWGTEQAWKMKYVYFDEIGNEPGTDVAGHAWTDAEFDDSSWSTLTGPIARYDTDFSVVNTIWEKENSCYYLRRTFNLDEVNAQGYYFCSRHDDNVKVWINGTQVVEAGYNGRCQYHHIPASAFVEGTNTMAIYLDDTGGGANLDYCMANFYLLKNVETGKYLNTGNDYGTHAILADEPLPARINRQQDGSYTIFFPVGSKNQQLLFRMDETNVYVDYSEEFENACPYWTITTAGGDTYHIQTLTTHESFGQSAMPGTYLGNNPNKEGCDNDVDGNITVGNNITWTIEPLPARTETQTARLQELVNAAKGLWLDTSDEEAVLNNNEATYLDMLETIYELQNRINEEQRAIWAVTSTDDIPAGTVIELDDITMTIGEAGSPNFTVDTWKPYDETFKNFISGNGVNGNKEGGTFYLFKPKKNGNLTVVVYQNRTKKFYVEESGRVMDAFNGITKEDEVTEGAYIGTYTIPVFANLTYKVYCSGSKMGLYGFIFKGRDDVEWTNIEFADEKVKALCVANWDTDHNGELSMTEAAAVTDINGVFNDNKEITSFDELRFFTGLTSLSFGALNECFELKSVCIPSSIVEMDGGAFASCHKLEYIGVDASNPKFKAYGTNNAVIERATNRLVVGCTDASIPDNITTIGNAAFWGHAGEWKDIPVSVTKIDEGAFAYGGLNGVNISANVEYIGESAFRCNGLWEVVIPAKVTYIGKDAFNECDRLEKVTVLNPNPIELINAETFNNRTNATLYVPVGSKAAYEAAPIWSDFKDIVEMVNIVKNSDLEGTDVDCFYSRVNYTEDETVLPATIVDGEGIDGSRGIVITSIDNPSETYDTQFFLRLPQTLPAGTKYRLSFDYKASQEASVTMEVHAEPSDYIDYGFDYMTFNTTWQHYEKVGEITEGQSPADHLMRTIAFDLSNIETATTYYLDNIVFEIDQFHRSPVISAIPESTIIPWGTEQAWEMKYVYSDEIGNEPGTDVAGHAWMDAEFDDSSWATLTGPIARNETDFSVVNTIWEKENSCYYLRRTFNLDEVNEQGYYFCSRHDDNVKVWINGTQVVKAGWNDRCQYHHIPASAFVKGTNTMAIYLDDTGGGAYLDYCMANFYLLKNVETGKYLNANDEWGAVLADEGLPVKLYKQADGSYTIYFPYGSQNNQLLYRVGEEGVFVDYSMDWAQFGVCPSWTFTDAGEGHIYIQSLTTDPTYGQEAMPGTYLGNNPSSNNVDGNITAGNNITWTVEPLPARTETQTARLQELVNAAKGLGLDTSGEEAVLNNSEATYLDMLETIYELQNRINEEQKPTQVEPTDISGLTDAIYVNASNGAKGGVATLNISLKNSQAATAYSFDLILPEGVTLAKDNNNGYIKSLSNRHNDQSATINMASEQVYKMVVVSLQSNEISGNDGVVLTLKLNLDDNLDYGDYAVGIKNAIYSVLSGAMSVKMPETIGVLTVGNYTKGDVNGDGAVDIADAVCIVNHVVGKPTPAFNAAAADANGDGAVDIADAVRIINLVVGKIQALARQRQISLPEPE